VAYVGVVGGGTRRSESAVRLKASDGEYAGKRLDSGIEEASSAARQIRDGTSQIHHHRHHHPYPSPSH
jgi:hypothetical protein